MSPHDDDNLDRSDHIRRALEALLGTPTTAGNRLDVLHNGDEIFPAMLEAIAAASRSIDLLTFVYWDGDIARRFGEALSERARAGVRVRVLLDAVGARRIADGVVDGMREAGCDVRWFRPVEQGEIGDVNHRTHRKVLVCDEVVAFTGGVGIADEWLGDARNDEEWRDTHFRVQGPAVAGLRGAFLGNWAETSGEMFDPAIDRFPVLEQPGGTAIQVVQGAAEVGWSNVSTMFRTLVCMAERSLRITTAYFAPDEHLLELICEAADRGVEVDILLPGPHADKRFVQILSEADYHTLHEAGARVWNFQPSMLHAKVMTVDGIVATVGSANVNNRSTQYDEEVNLVVYDDVVTELLDVRFDQDLLRAEPIDPHRWGDRGVVRRATERVVGVARGLV